MPHDTVHLIVYVRGMTRWRN